MNELFIIEIIDEAKKGVVQDRLYDIGRFNFCLSKKEVNKHIKEAISKGVYRVKDMENITNDYYYQFG
ncbi:MAG: hypothetical protein WC319_03840 [Candidatus Paceibacterota bacterium]